jgi:hypothetical protein
MGTISEIGYDKMVPEWYDALCIPDGWAFGSVPSLY